MAVDALTNDLEGTAEERENADGNFIIGTRLMCENEEVRVWETIVPAGERCRFHKHRTNYMWVIHEPARMRVRSLQGDTLLYDHVEGEVTFIQVEGEPDVIHDLANVDDHDFRATVIELKNNDVAAWRPVEG